MDLNKYSLSHSSFSIPTQDAKLLLDAADSNAALLYLWLLDGRGFEGFGKAAHLSAAQVRASAEKLKELGLLAEKENPLPAPDNEMPEFTAEEISERASSDLKFSAVLAEAERLLGHVLSGADMRILFGIYSHLGLPADVLFELMNYCVEEHKNKFGPGRTPSVKRFEKEAYHWAGQEIMTLSLADEYLRMQKRRADTAEKLKISFGIKSRDLTATERKYIDSWLGMGFGREAIEIAFDRTVTNLGSLKWPYMNKILLSWDKKGLHSPKEINEGDGAAKPAAKTQDKKSSSRDDYEQIKKALNKVKK